MVAHYGTAGTTSLGVLGAGSPDHAAKRLQTAANKFAAGGRPVLPAMELITTVADQSPGPHGTYSHQLTTGQARSYLHAARAHHQMLILDIQPGRSDFLTQLRPWWSLLAQPDVGLALDSEWRMPGGATPGARIGHVDAHEVNAVTARLARFVRAHRLPQKLFVLHQFTAGMVGNVSKIAPHRELAMVQHLDGFGARAEKLAKYRRLQHPDRFHLGFKLFYTQDTDLMSPTDVLKLHPPPEYVSYQ